jgi:hypothetical protein
MLTVRRFGKKLNLPSTIQIKHQILLRWLEDQTEIEAAEVRQQTPASPTKTKNFVKR